MNGPALARLVVLNVVATVVAAIIISRSPALRRLMGMEWTNP